MRWTPFDYKNQFNACKAHHYDNWRLIDGGMATLELQAQMNERNAALDALTPMDVLESAMRKALRDDDYKRAAMYAEKLLPYKAPRLSAIATTEVKRAERIMDFSELDISELQALHRVAIVQRETRH